MATAAEIWQEKGMQQGMQKGAKIYAEETVVNMLKRHFDAETISQCTNLSVDKVKEIAIKKAALTEG